MSNEDIIFTYLNFKYEIGRIDKDMKRLEEYVKDKKKEIPKMMGNVGEEEVSSQLLSIVKSLMGGEIPGIDNATDGMTIREIMEAQLNHFADECRKKFIEHLEARIRIVENLEEVYEILKEEMPETVEKYTNMMSSREGYGN